MPQPKPFSESWKRTVEWILSKQHLLYSIVSVDNDILQTMPIHVILYYSNVFYTEFPLSHSEIIWKELHHSVIYYKISQLSIICRVSGTSSVRRQCHVVEVKVQLVIQLSTYMNLKNLSCSWVTGDTIPLHLKISVFDMHKMNFLSSVYRQSQVGS